MMDVPFVFGRIASGDNFTDRKVETARLIQNFLSLTNTIIVSPRRWGKSSLVACVARQVMQQAAGIKICSMDLFNVRTEEEFYLLLANEVLKATATKWEELVEDAKNFLSRLIPRISFSAGMDSELSFGVEWEELKRNPDDILDLAETLAVAKNIRIVVCIDEFQNVTNFSDGVAFQKKLRAHWQRHTHVSYCLFGSKRHMLLEVFTDVSMPFYKFGDLIFLQKIDAEEWIPFIRRKFADTGKEIDREAAMLIVKLVDNHPYYVQQLAQQVWFRTERIVVEPLVREAYQGVLEQLDWLFSSMAENMTTAQLNFLKALIAGEKSLSSRDILKKYNMGTSGNVVKIRKSLEMKEVIDVMGDKITFQDPLFEAWLREKFR